MCCVDHLQPKEITPRRKQEGSNGPLSCWLACVLLYGILLLYASAYDLSQEQVPRVGSSIRLHMTTACI